MSAISEGSTAASRNHRVLSRLASNSGEDEKCVNYSVAMTLRSNLADKLSQVKRSYIHHFSKWSRGRAHSWLLQVLRQYFSCR